MHKQNDLMAKMIYWNLCKNVKIDSTKKLYMQDPESVLENVTDKIIWDFDIQTDHLISARPQDLVIVKKKRESAE